MLYCPNPECPHRLATGHAAEFAGELTRCSDCETPLEASNPDEAAEAAANRPIEMVVLGELSAPGLVAAARELLEEAGIGFEISGEGVQDLFGVGRWGSGYNLVTGPPKLLVEAGRLDEARELMTSLERSAPEERTEGEL